MAGLPVPHPILAPHLHPVRYCWQKTIPRREVLDDVSQLNRIAGLLDRIADSRSRGEKWDAFAEVFADAGSAFLNAGEIDTRTGEVISVQSTMRADWVDRYVEQEFYSVDPLIHRAGATTDPIVWTRSHIHHLPESADLRLRGLYLELAESGYDKTIGVPCPLGDTGRVRIVSFGPGQGDGDATRSETFLTLRMLAPFVALHAMPLEPGNSQLIYDRMPVLSPRERDVLCLLACGHMNARIAERLGIAEPTVRKHMISAREKLGCATREQALAVAITRGLISP